MSGADQFFTFLVCVACGVAGGVIYDFFYLLRVIFPARWVRISGDVLFCLLFGALYVFVTVMMGLTGLRLYTLLGCVGGLFLYLKSFHKIVAFFLKKVYNGLKQAWKGYRRCPRRTKAAIPKTK